MFAGLDITVLYVLERFFPVIAKAEIARGFFHFRFAPGHLFIGNGNQLFGRVGNHLKLQFADEGLTTDGIADNVTRVSGTSLRCARSLKTGAAWTAGLATAAASRANLRCSLS